MPDPDFVSNQQPMFDEFERTMTSMLEAFVALHGEASAELRAELAEVCKLNREIGSVPMGDAPFDELLALATRRQGHLAKVLELMTARG